MDALVQTWQEAPQFELPNVSGELFSLESWSGWIRVLNFWSAECTWCERVDRELLSYLASWTDRVKVIWIASNANETSNLIGKVALDRCLPLVLLDTKQQVADLYGAQTTPHFFVVDRDGKLAYQGAWDDITFRKRVATQAYVAEVVESLANHQTPQLTHTPPYGCVLVRSNDVEA